MSFCRYVILWSDTYRIWIDSTKTYVLIKRVEDFIEKVCFSSLIFIVILDVFIFEAVLVFHSPPWSDVQMNEKTRNKVYGFLRIQWPVIERNFDEINSDSWLHARVPSCKGIWFFNWRSSFSCDEILDARLFTLFDSYYLLYQIEKFAFWQKF